MEAETTYHYAVSAINPDGTSLQSDTISATTQAEPEPVSKPSAPTGLRTLATEDLWYGTTPADDTITGYPGAAKQPAGPSVSDTGTPATVIWTTP